ncbi:MAG: glycosyltransferase family 4 protein [Candidatus Omnitrophota bacterium]
MKILLLTTHLNIGGIGIYTVGLAKYLKAGGVEVAVASGGGELETVLKQAGVPHFTLDIRTKSEFGIKVWKALPGLAEIVSGGGFQLVHAQTRVTQVLARLSQKTTKVPFISTCHGFFRHRKLSRRIFPCWGERVIAISKSVRTHLVEDFRVDASRVVLIYNGIELDRYLPASAEDKDRVLLRETGLDPDAMIIGSVGRLSPVKGFKYLLRAFKDVISRFHGKTQLLILGEGPEKDSLLRLARQIGIADNVFLVSAAAPLEKYLAIMDVFCLPSLKEGLGLSLMEAMAASRACIASDIGGLSELITHERDGILVPSGNVGTLSAAILLLAESREKRQRLAENAREKAAEKFSIRDSVAKTIGVYEAIIK